MGKSPKFILKNYNNLGFPRAEKNNDNKGDQSNFLNILTQMCNYNSYTSFLL